MENKKLIEWIRKWNKGSEYITLSTIFAKMKSGKGKTHVISHGPPGVGKSRSTLELIQLLDLGDDIILDNTTTDKGLFETFMEFSEQDIILDECSTLLKNLKTQDMVKLCMESKPITWTKDGSSETTPPYRGNLIINSNVEIADSVIDRSLMNKVGMNKEMSLEFNEYYVEQLMNPTNFDPLINHLKKVLSSEKNLKLSNEEIKYILTFVNSKIRDLEKTDYSRRIILRLINYFERTKNLFGSLDKEVLDFIEPYAETYISNENSPGLVESILGNGEIEKPILVKRMSKETGWTEQYVRKIINKELEEGKLVLKGKFVSLNKR